jgi:Zn-dependent protease
MAGDLACPACGMLVHLARLQELSKQAQQMEAADPTGAARLWRQCLELVPGNSPAVAPVRERINALETAGAKRSIWHNPFIRTGGSMLVSMIVYSFAFGAAFAIGFVILIWVHEMGHSLVLRRYGVKRTAPLFIPFVGAVITVFRLRDAAQEAIMAIAGPVAGTIGALVCFGLWWVLHWEVLLIVSCVAFAMNLFNLLPIPPLDGGRVTAAVSPWIWPLGFLAVLYRVGSQLYQGYVNPIPILILLMAGRRVWTTLRSGYRDDPYYQIPRRTSVLIGVAYVLLGLFLSGMVYWTNSLGADLF